MNSSEYRVTIKSANQKVDDYVTTCRPEWTVQRLKKHISETHISKPSIDDQRLIYAGNLLKDSHTLKQIFFRDSLCTEMTNSNKSDFTLHLVCYTKSGSNGSNVKAPTTSRVSSIGSSAGSTSNQHVSPQSQPIISNTVRPTTTPQGPTVRGAPITLFNTSSNNHPANNIVNQNRAELEQNLLQSDQMRRQMAVFQQLSNMVAAQIVSHVANNQAISRNSPSSTTLNESLNRLSNLTSSLVSGQAMNVQITTSPINISTTASQMLYAGNRQPAQIVGSDGSRAVVQNENLNNGNGNGVAFGAQIQAPEPAQAPVAEQPQLQAAQEAAAPIIQHDVIDWVYYSIRAAVLMAALYIHASMFRLLFIVSLLAIAYFFNRRSARRAQPARQEQQAQPQQQQQHPPQQQQLPVAGPQQVAQEDAQLRRRNVNRDEQPVNGDNIENRNETNDNNNEADGARAHNEIIRGRLPFLKLCYLVVTDFLASLVPE